MKLSKVSDFRCPHCHKPIMVATHINDSEPSSVIGDDKVQKKNYELNVEIEIQGMNE